MSRLVMLYSVVLALFVACELFAGSVAKAETSTLPPPAGVPVGQQAVTGSSWNFSSDLSSESGPWGSVTVTNTNCAIPYRSGSAQAGAVIFTAPLSPGFGHSVMLEPFTGSAASGQVELLPMADTGGVNVTASLDGLEPSVVGTTLTVCLTLASPPPMLANIDVDQQRVAASNFDVTGVSTAATDTNQTLIGISGTRTSSSGINRQMVFFFLDDQYLGTDTRIPSLASLQLMGSPGQAQIDVSYSDPSGGPPVTITYTLSNGTLDPSGTPPGHNSNLSSFPKLANGAYNLGNAKLAGGDFANLNLAGANLSGADLSNANFSNTNLSGADLSNANLSGANLTRTDLKGATGLSSATLTGVIWSNTTCPDNTTSNADGGTCIGHL